jgi:hypothetical protein
MLRVLYSQQLTAAAMKKNNNWQLSVLPIYNFGQKCLNGATDWSDAKDGQIFPHFEQILSGAWMPLCPIAAVF